MAPPRIGREILNQLPPKIITLPDGRKVRPLHSHFDSDAILSEAKKLSEADRALQAWTLAHLPESWTQITTSFEKRLTLDEEIQRVKGGLR